MDDAHGCASVAGGMDAVSDRIYSVSQMLALCCIRVWCSAAALELHPHLVTKVTQF